MKIAFHEAQLHAETVFREPIYIIKHPSLFYWNHRSTRSKSCKPAVNTFHTENGYWNRIKKFLSSFTHHSKNAM